MNQDELSCFHNFAQNIRYIKLEKISISFLGLELTLIFSWKSTVVNEKIP
jgi:hypothetical protein